MSYVPSHLKYTKSHEWLKIEGDIATVGITDHAQNLLGDIVYLELPDIGAQFDQGDECAVVESVKAAADIYIPVAGKVTAVNEALRDSPELVNKDPYQEGWIFKIKLGKAGDQQHLLTNNDYMALANAEH